jgi:two-component system, OmpR family, KDP operon response regulator KdpE
VVAQARSLVEARYAASLRLDVAVLDFDLPDDHGADLIGALREPNSGVAVLILSAKHDSQNRERATDAGADEILDKVTSTTEVVGAIRCLGRG